MKIKKKVKKSKKSIDGEPTKTKKTKSKLKSKPVDPLEAFLAGDEDRQASEDYETL